MEWEAGPAAADSKYGGKIIEIEGSVKEYGAIFKDRKEAGGYVQIGSMDVLFKDVRCEFAVMDWREKISRKTKVKIKGLWLPTPPPDRRVGVAQAITRDKCSLENCVFTEIGPNARLLVTAEEMSALARSDEEQFRAIYGDYHTEVLVTAEVESVERIRGNNVCLILKTSAPPRVMIELGDLGYSPDREAKMKAEYPPGTKVSLKGIYNSAINYGKPELYLSGTLKKE